MSKHNSQQAVDASLDIAPPTKRPQLMARIYIPERMTAFGKKGFVGSLQVIQEGTHGLVCNISDKADSIATEWFANKHIIRTYTVDV